MTWVATAIVGGAVVGAGASIYASNKASKSQSKAASKAASAELQAAELSIEEQRRQFDEIQALLAPFVSAGESSLTQQLNLIGLGGPVAQRAAIAGIERSPQFEALTRSGEEAILQGASATGGLRGGNVQAALAEFRPSVLSQLIENQYSKLSGLTGLGQASAAGVGAAGAQTSSNISNILQSMGASQAARYTAQGTADAQRYLATGSAINSIAGAIPLGIYAAKNF